MSFNHNRDFPNAPKVRLGDYIKRSTVNNRDEKYGIELIEGVTNEGVFSKPKGNPMDVDLKPYKIVNNGAFVYNPSRLDVGSIAYRTAGLCIVSHLYIVFYLNDEGKKKIDPDWLFMYFRRDEFYREVTFRNFGSQRPEFNFNDMSDIMIPLPGISVQRKYVSIYKAMVANQLSYRRGLEDLKLICDSYIETLRKKIDCEKIGSYIKEIDVRNKNNKVTLLQGFCMSGDFIEPRRTSVDIPSLKILNRGEMIYNRAVECVTDKFIVSIREGETCAVSNSYIIFTSKDEKKLLNKYLLLWLKRKEFARYSKFKSHGTAHENFEFDDLCEVQIPIPNIEIQQSIIDIYECYTMKKSIADKLAVQIREISPVLIKGSIEEVKEA